ncbi:hypothetical protein [Streptomyces glomeratus]|uniref:Uncharacterized protein n=1 Tax=Streptomyces glomeratus TaxID=284452 RepID=A0ABP6LNE7_9ACTN
MGSDDTQPAGYCKAAFPLPSVTGSPPAPASTRGTQATPYRWFRIFPRRIQAWREVNEMSGRELMRDGRWLV